MTKGSTKPFEDNIHMTSSTEMDFVTAVEGGAPLPIAFKTRAALDDWRRENDLDALPIGRRRKAIVVSGRVKPWGYPEGYSYQQVWVAANYRRYRDAVKFRLKTTEGSIKDVHLYDGDHAVSKTRLMQAWPEAWVNMILVESSVNQSIGAMMEKDPLLIDVDQDRIDLNAECILKAFLRKTGPLTRSDLGLYLSACRTRFISFSQRQRPVPISSAPDVLEEFAMSERADRLFVKIAESVGVEPNSVLGKKRMMIIR
ncbi:hypothetical protein KUV61_17895 [Nocardioides marinus]|nr:hypothetical protein [Nocardioides marinus]